MPLVQVGFALPVLADLTLIPPPRYGLYRLIMHLGTCGIVLRWFCACL